MTDDTNRVYFQNLKRRPAREELEEVLNIVRDAGYTTIDAKMMGSDDIYRCFLGKIEFDIIFTGEETFIYTDKSDDISAIEKIFE